LSKIPVGQLLETPGWKRVYDFLIDASPLDLAEEGVTLHEPFRVRIEAAYNDGKVLLRGFVSAKVGLVCGRCLSSFSCPLTGGFEEEIEVEGRTVLDVVELVRESYFAALPLKPLCHPDCRGLCPQCGEDLNQKQCHCRREHLDHRLLVLKKLLDQD
jgi:uncharacterized protein